MTWSIEYTTERDDLDVKISGGHTPEILEAQKHALNAAADIICSPALGGPENVYQVRIVGHSNPNNEPVAGWSNDSVTISIYQTGDKR